jgi:hypothetical protein
MRSMSCGELTCAYNYCVIDELIQHVLTTVYIISFCVLTFSVGRFPI